jgi:hypothetical protein
MEEIWKPIEFVHSDYQVSNLGRVRSCRKNKLDKFTLLKGTVDKSGYIYFCLSNDERKNFKVSAHRLVAQAFISNTDPKLEVNHINGIKTDNRVENLEWVTHSDNIKHSYRTGLQYPIRGGNHKLSKLTDELVLDMRYKYSTGNYTQRQLAEEFKIGTSHVHRIVNKITWKHI